MIHTVYDVTDCATPNPDSADLLASMRETVRLLGCTVLGRVLQMI